MFDKKVLQAIKTLDGKIVALETTVTRLTNLMMLIHKKEINAEVSAALAKIAKKKAAAKPVDENDTPSEIEARGPLAPGAKNVKFHSPEPPAGK